MATRGRKPITKAQKKAKGETRPSRTEVNVVEFPVLDNSPVPPEWLNDEGVKLWNEIVPILFKQRVLTNADLHALSHMCQLHGEIVDGYSRRVRPTAADLSQLRMYFSEFGMTPSSRTRIGVTGKGKDDNPFNRNGKKTGTQTN